jgi:hypothetical protein
VVEVQVTLVAGPRNHLYRTGHPLIEDWPFLFAFSQADLDHLRNLADDFHVEAALSFGDFGQHLDDEKIDLGTAYAVLQICVEVAASVTRDLANN